ncbi:MAG: ABC transporter ATP-binding protein [Chthonomonadales bacterium]|nr:ABC transporter ATP-binding protein [Chthonomonadales bacterium]
MHEPLLRVDNLHTRFRTSDSVVEAVRGVSFHVDPGEVVGLVGESGSGKSVTALSLMRLLPDPPARVEVGTVRFEGRDLLGLSERDMTGLRGGRMAMVFQDPFSALNPTMTLGEQVAEAARCHGAASHAEARRQALDLLRAVRIPSPELRYRQYPHQVSGGQRQRVMIAMAFAGEPSLLIADEPTTALDVTVQAQIMSLMADLQRRTGAAVLLITHDLGIVAEMCDRVLVMYAGQVVESAPVDRVFHAPSHPYTVGLLRSLPPMEGPRHARLSSIPGQPPDLAALAPGCPFAPRCPLVMEVCRERAPEPVEVAPGHTARCHAVKAGG